MKYWSDPNVLIKNLDDTIYKAQQTRDCIKAMQVYSDDVDHLIKTVNALEKHNDDLFKAYDNVAASLEGALELIKNIEVVVNSGVLGSCPNNLHRHIYEIKKVLNESARIVER